MEGEALQRLSADYLSLINGGGELGGLISGDVTFCVEGRQVQAHRCILAARSHFFRLMFAQHQQSSPTSHASGLMISSSSNGRPPINPASPPPPPPPPLLFPVDVVGFDAFLCLLRFLYSGQLLLSIHQPSSPCPLPSCPHSSCSSAVDLLLQLIHAAYFFGVHELADLVQIKLGNVLEEGVSMESLLRVLIMAKKHKMQRLWHLCAELVMSTGLGCDVLRRYLPSEVIAELTETMKLQRSGYIQSNMQSGVSNNMNSSHLHSPQNVSNSSTNCTMMMCSIGIGACCSEEQRILRLQQALDCMDVELVRLMVMGEGLDLDKALALHYSVANCNREVVKALLELGVVDVNYSDMLGRTALHLAADMGNADMIAVLLDHHADPNALTHDGFAAVDILHGLIKAGTYDHFHQHMHIADQLHPTAIAPLCKADQKRIHLCIELLQSAAAVAGREEAAESSCVTQAPVSQQVQIMNSQLNQEASGFMSHSNNLQLIRDDLQGRPMTTSHFNQKSSRASQISPMSSAQMISDDRRHPIIPPQYNQEAPAAAAVAASTSTIAATDQHHRARMTPQINGISGTNCEAGSLISQRAADHRQGNHHSFLFSCTYPGGLQSLQIPSESANIHAQEGKSTNTGTGSSSEE